MKTPYIIKKSFVPWQKILANWPDSKPIVGLFDPNGWSILALDHNIVDENIFFKQTVLKSPSSSTPSKEKATFPFLGGIIGLIPYETFAGIQPILKPTLYQVNELLLIHNINKLVYHVHKESTPKVDANQYLSSSKEPNCNNKTQRTTPYRPYMDPVTHANKIEIIQDHIRNGKYYQLNLLNYFELEVLNFRSYAKEKLSTFPGPFSCLFDTKETSLFSLSPERFFKLRPNQTEFKISVEPIKGTIARSNDSQQDKFQKKTLQTSTKDKAELSIIIDLLRNDLNICSKPGSVVVETPFELRTFSHLHHLVATISAYLPNQIKIYDIFKSLLPAGSITGAPKKTVIHQIKELEEIPRGYFMGSCFYHCQYQQTIDASVLIRTLHKRSNKYLYAAGGGITLKSTPSLEVAESLLKAKAFFGISK